MLNIRYILLFVVLISSKLHWAQVNLVPNGNFEDYTSCPIEFDDIFLAAPWYSPTGDTPDYYNSCNDSVWSGWTHPYGSVPENLAGFQFDNDGQGYAGIAVYWPNDFRDYIQLPLIDTLLSGKKYYIEFYCNVADAYGECCMGGSDNLGAAFSDTAHTKYLDSLGNPFLKVLPLTPFMKFNYVVTDTVGWTKLSTIYTANGGEAYLTIGNFYTHAQSHIVNVTNPSGDTTTIAAYFYIDDVYVGEYIPPVDTSDTSSVMVEPAINPNPASDHLLLTYSLKESKTGLFVVYNSIGQVVLIKPLEPFNGTKTLPLPTLASGVYIASIILDNSEVLQKKIVVAK